MLPKTAQLTAIKENHYLVPTVPRRVIRIIFRCPMFSAPSVFLPDFFLA